MVDQEKQRLFLEKMSALDDTAFSDDSEGSDSFVSGHSMVEECMNILNGNEAAANPPSRAPQLTNLTSVVTGQDDTLMPPSNNSSTPRYQQPINNNSPQVVQPRHLSYVTTPPTAHQQFGTATNPPYVTPQLTNLTAVVTGQDDALMPSCNNSSTPCHQQPINNNSP